MASGRLWSFTTALVGLYFALQHFSSVSGAPDGAIDASRVTSSDKNVEIPAGTSALDETANNSISSWEAPLEFQKRFPFYLTGYDYDNLPVWVAEFGHFDIRGLVERGEGPLFDKYLDKLLNEIVPKSMASRSTPENPIEEIALIVDYEDLSINQLLHVPTIEFCLGLVRKYRYLAEKHLRRGYIVNANYVAERAINVGRPYFGRVLEKIEVYGNNKSKWIPQLLRTIPADQLPEWYGGSKGHKPVIIYG